MPRTATVTRTTKETDIRLSLDLDGLGRAQVATGIGFFDHMLDQVARHGLIDLDIECQGDLHIDGHHTVEDVGITLGMAVAQAQHALQSQGADALLLIRQVPRGRQPDA